jgi:hypothetical protein
MLETPRMQQYDTNRKNLLAADNQQGRPEGGTLNDYTHHTEMNHHSTYIVCNAVLDLSKVG